MPWSAVSANVRKHGNGVIETNGHTKQTLDEMAQ